MLLHIPLCSYFVVVVIFFFKQKTAYEMRISDWSSDVCSSDLVSQGRLVTLRQQRRGRGAVDVEALHLTLRLPNGSEYQHNGRVQYAESEVDPHTGTLAIRLVFPNPDDLLLSNQFVTLLTPEGKVPSLQIGRAHDVPPATNA